MRIKDLKLNTICTHSLCPNISECYASNHAAFLILGNICTRNCSFCNVSKGHPHLVDESEPSRIVSAVVRLNVKHIVITSPTRDDIPDGGAGVFVRIVDKIKKLTPDVAIELLVPDFGGSIESIKKVAASKADIIGHNIETVRRLYRIRNSSDYDRSLKLLKSVKTQSPHVPTKSALMLGLGETKEEVQETMADIRQAGCSLISIGQYLAPSNSHYSIREYIEPEKFEEYKRLGITMGFTHIESGPYVRSSYKARDYLQ